jgi:hypothetical protein
MNSLYLAWQAPDHTCEESRAWYPIGRLDAELEGNQIVSCRYRYTRGALAAQRDLGFEPLVSLPDFRSDYTSEKLFPVFQNRVLSPKRADYPEFISWLDLTQEQADPIAIMSLSGGSRETDNLHTIPKLEQNADGSCKIRFFLQGLRYLAEEPPKSPHTLKAGDQLLLMVGANQSATALSICLLDKKENMVGWTPDFLADDLIHCIRNAPEIKATVVKVNGAHAPWDQSVLVEYSGRTPNNYQLMASPDFSLLVD